MSVRPALVLALLVCSPALAGGPASFRAPVVAPDADVPIVVMPPVDVAKLLADEKALREATLEKVSWIGTTRKLGLDPGTAGLREDLADGTIVRRLRVRSPEALWLVLGFTTFRPGPDTTVWVYSADRSVVLGPFGGADVRSHGQLWIPPVEGDTVFVEVDGEEKSPSLFLGEVMHGYKRFGSFDANLGGTKDEQPDAGSCNIDVNCPLGANWQDEKHGVVNLLTSSGGYCSGSLITNTGADCKNYVLTAHHCLSSQGTATATIFQFNFERPMCGAGVAPTNQTLTGSFLRATYTSSDFTLLEMDDEIPETYLAYYNGWTHQTTPATLSWCIHHPNNDEKKISYNDDPLFDGINWGATHWRVNDYEQGTTEPGSSGSPLFDESSRIVGQLHGGTASCTSITYDEFGKVAVSWEGGGSAATRLKDWLDPGGTGALTADGLDAATCRIPQPKLSYESSVADDSAGNGNAVAEPGETVVLRVTTRNGGTLDATSVAGTLSTAKAGVVLGDAQASWPDIPQTQIRESDAPHFTLSLDPSFVCGDPIPLRVDWTAAEAPGTWTANFSLPTGTANVTTSFQDAMESGTNGWTVQTGEGSLAWNQTTADSASPTHSWFVQDIATRAETRLMIPPLTGIGATPVLRFKHRYNTEGNYDGGVLEYSTNGTTWTDASSRITQGGYTGSISSGASSALAGRAAWAGDSGGWKDVTVDLSGLGGSTLYLRWRFATDTSVSREGWYVDDVVVDRTDYTCQPASAVPLEARSVAFSKDPGGFRIDWAPPSGGPTPTGYRLYRTALGAPAAPECEADLGSGTNVVLTDLTDDRGFLVVARTAAGEGSYGTDSSGGERSPASVPCP